MTYAHVSTDDYIPVTVDLTFNSGTSSHDVMVNALHDTVSEGDEVISLSLTDGGDDAVMFIISSATVAITDASKSHHTIASFELFMSVIPLQLLSWVSVSLPIHSLRGR